MMILFIIIISLFGLKLLVAVVPVFSQLSVFYLLFICEYLCVADDSVRRRQCCCELIEIHWFWQCPWVWFLLFLVRVASCFFTTCRQVRRFLLPNGLQKCQIFEAWWGHVTHYHIISLERLTRQIFFTCRLYQFLQQDDTSPTKEEWLWSRDCFKIVLFVGDAARRAGLSATAELLVI